MGLSPSIALYNGFNVLDMYTSTFPLNYKYEFRKIIAKELEKNDEIKGYFDNVAKRCYAYSAELGRFNLSQLKKVTNLEWDTQAIKNLNGKYIISRVEIENYKQMKIKFHRLFKRDGSKYEIYLYEVL